MAQANHVLMFYIQAKLLIVFVNPSILALSGVVTGLLVNKSAVDNNHMRQHCKPDAENIKQFNGSFGCELCLSKGKTIAKGRGYDHVNANIMP